MRTVGARSPRCCRRHLLLLLLFVPSWVLTGREDPWWPRRYPAAHLSDSLPWPPPSCSWCRWPPWSPPKATRSRFTGTVWSSVSAPTAPELSCGASSPPSRSTWRWQVSCLSRWQVKLTQLASSLSDSEHLFFVNSSNLYISFIVLIYAHMCFELGVCFVMFLFVVVAVSLDASFSGWATKMFANFTLVSICITCWFHSVKRWVSKYKAQLYPNS